MTTENKNPNRPTHGIYVVQGEDDKARWTKIGAAWLHKDKRGLNLDMTSLPLAGRLVIREFTEKDQTAEETAGTENGGQQ